MFYNGFFSPLDFLPIYCEHCDRAFCKTHSSLSAHNCLASGPTYQCHQPTSQSRFHSFDNAVEDDDRICNYHACNQRQVVLLSCESCSGNFCISHKQKEVHQCPSLIKSNQSDEVQPAKIVDRAALDAISYTPVFQKKTNDLTTMTKPLSDRARATKAKLILLKTKMEALPGGNRARQLPESERFVVRLSVMPDIILSKYSMISAYFGKRWPLGCILDFGCEHFSLPRDKNYGLIRLVDELNEYSGGECSHHEHDSISNSFLDLGCSLQQHVEENCFIEGQLLQIVRIPQT
ncbi:AN1-type zinc finger protein isoform 3 [Schistosoma japonicum]|uniref:AN1-type zinc finger protein isoform 3 n=1 Tax=Schistosoma japonicum TaxID=6182 RepID=A0A4Z2D545_SCHJA|nr:AN1-type zinc finger protein 2B [Schistosoma japonicum]TNN11613.1 AN1-type zinc finger protein isoform 3 [Schistosoma japonicum]